MTPLKTRTLGKSGIEVTEIGMGLWAAGGDAWGPTFVRPWNLARCRL